MNEKIAADGWLAWISKVEVALKVIGKFNYEAGIDGDEESDGYGLISAYHAYEADIDVWDYVDGARA